MMRPSLRSSVALGCISFLAILTAQTTDPIQLARSVDGALKAVPFGVRLEDWRRTHPSATCRQHYPLTIGRDAPERPEPEGDWCTLCEEHTSNQTAEWTFYPLRPELPLACRLEHLRLYVDGPVELVNDVHKRTVDFLQAIDSFPHDAATDNRPSEFGRNFWKDAKTWATDEVVIASYIYSDDYRKLPPRAAVSIEDRRLDGRLFEEKRGFRRIQLIEEVVAALRRSHPDIAATLTDMPGGGRPSKNPRVREVLTRTVEAARKATGPQKAILLLAADRLSEYVTWTFPPDLDPHDQSLKQFADAGLTFEARPEHDGRLTPTGNLLKLVSERYANSRWGDRALLEQLNSCDEDENRFRSVIDEATHFLAARPASRYRLDVMFALAQAFETWWSLSQAVDDQFVKPEDYQSGADEARRKAIAWYEKVVDLVPGSDMAFEASRKTARLSLKLDTGQREFSCPNVD
jgi:hypothetical protein